MAAEHRPALKFLQFTCRFWSNIALCVWSCAARSRYDLASDRRSDAGFGLSGSRGTSGRSLLAVAINSVLTRSAPSMKARMLCAKSGFSLPISLIVNSVPFIVIEAPETRSNMARCAASARLTSASAVDATYSRKCSMRSAAIDSMRC